MNTLLAAAALAAVLAGSLGAPTANLLRPDAVGAKPSGAALPGAIRQIPLVLASSHSKASRDKLINEMAEVCLKDCVRELAKWCRAAITHQSELELRNLNKQGKAVDLDYLHWKWGENELQCNVLAIKQNVGQGSADYGVCKRNCRWSQQRLLNRPYP